MAGARVLIMNMDSPQEGKYLEQRSSCGAHSRLVEDGNNIYILWGETCHSFGFTTTTANVEFCDYVQNEYKKVFFCDDISSEFGVNILDVVYGMLCVLILQITPMEKPRSFSSVAFLGEDLYICGGMGESGCTNYVEVYNSEDNSWRVGMPMLKRRGGAGVTVMDGRIYVIGGQDSYGYEQSSVERYAPDIGVWEELPQMLCGRAFFGATVMNGKINVCGGIFKMAKLNTVECFDPKTMRWSAVTPMLVPVADAAVVSHGNRIFVIGV
ncbi:kelch repeat protein [Ancylostoma duodenale]|uniref:Kelch repeat protein n=1 Tax=Ancylostoma duodenale TaxID=51022 RepID=A0A0C2GDR3_9BILA|nr:kelch repeat protein [Ancylostoma duodenale]